MSTLKAMPCISNSKVAILSCFNRPQLSAHSPILLSTLWRHPIEIFHNPKLAGQLRSGLTYNSRWHSCCGVAFRGSKKRDPSSGCRGFDSVRIDWGSSSSGSNVRTFASSPQGSDGLDGSEGSQASKGLTNEKAAVKKILGKGLLVGAAEALEERLNKPEICTADELHYVAVPGTKWRLALWRYRPPPNTPERNHPLLMLSGIGTNALGFDLDPSVSMARCMAGAGFDTWILEVRGAGLSKSEEELAEEGKPTETSNGAFVDNKMTSRDDKTNPPTKGFSEPSSAEGTVADMDPPTKRSSDLTSVEGTWAEVNSSTESSSKLTSGEQTLAKMDAQTERSSERTSEEGTASELDSQTERSSELTNGEGTMAEVAAETNRSSDLTSVEGTLPKVDSPAERSSESTSKASAMAKMDSPTKRSRKLDSDEVTMADQEDSFEFSLKSVRGGATWETATRLSNTIVNLSNTLSKLLTEGQAKLLSARFIDSVVSLFEYSALSKGISGLRERLASLLEARNNSSTVVIQLADLRKKLAQLLEDGQDAVSPRVTNLQERLSSTVDDFQKIVDLIAKYDWDFENYLEEDVPTAMEYIRNRCKPADGKLLSVGHSMGGIVLYALLSTRGNKSGLVGAVALASALDYQCSDTSLKLLLPLTDPAQVLNVPVVPLGGLMTAVHPFVTRPPYVLAWLGYQISAQNMMTPELFSKLVLNNFGTIPVKLLLHLATVFQPGGLANRDGTVKYKKSIGKVNIPVLAIAGDQDLICPPPAVLDTVQIFPKETITYKCFGGENDRHYGHYDIVCSPGAKEEVFPIVLDFLVENDKVQTGDKVKIEVEA